MTQVGNDVDDERWRAVQERDRSKDGVFVYGVVTTGVYCKPSCGSRRALRPNVRFYADAQAARRDGLRACKRCRPDAPTNDMSGDAVRAAVRAMQRDPRASVNLAGLAARAGMSESHFHRTFRKLVGTTPKKYGDGLRMALLKRELKVREDVTDSMYASGFGSSSRVYERSDRELGMTPAEYRAGGKGVTITYVCVPSPLGRMMLAATDRGLCFLQFGESCEVLTAMLRKEFAKATLEPMQRPAHAHLEQWLGGLDAYLRGAKERLEMPVDVRATAFQLRVWEYLRGIPYGQVECYSAIAQKLGLPTSTRAVARAIASNSIALLVPCHRVIRNNGELGGYRWGLERKRALLDMERGGVAGS